MRRFVLAVVALAAFAVAFGSACHGLIVNLPPIHGCQSDTDCNCLSTRGKDAGIFRLCSASPSPSPVLPPSPAPSPSPVSSPSPEPSASPSPVATPEPTPTPVPTPEPQPTPKCAPAPPSTMVPVVGQCQKGWTCSEYQGKTIRVAPSVCESHDCAVVWPSNGQADRCAPWTADSIVGGLRAGHYQLQNGLVFDEGRGFYDAYARHSKDGQTPVPGFHGDPEYLGACAVRVCSEGPGPSPLPSPSPKPAPSPGFSDVAKLLTLNYGKCVIGQPFVFYLGSCKEMLITATPKADPPCEVGNCDAQHHGRALSWWFVYDGRRYDLPDDEEVETPIGRFIPGPEELTFNRTFIGSAVGNGELHCHLIAPDGKEFDAKVANVQVTR